MDRIKLTTWNIEHLSKMLPEPSQNKKEKFESITQEIKEIDPDILCIIERPGSLTDLRSWVSSDDGLSGRYEVATIPGTDEILQQNPQNPRKALQKLYGMKGTDTTGNQWIWFLVKQDLFQQSDAEIIAPATWKGLTKQKTWKVHHWGQRATKTHSHWRHPQTLCST